MYMHVRNQLILTLFFNLCSKNNVRQIHIHNKSHYYYNNVTLHQPLTQRGTINNRSCRIIEKCQITKQIQKFPNYININFPLTHTHTHSPKDVPWHPKEYRRVNLLHGVEQRTLEGVWLGKPARPGRQHGGIDVQELGGHVTHGEVADHMLGSYRAVDVLLHSTTHPSQLGGGGREGQGVWLI